MYNSLFTNHYYIKKYDSLFTNHWLFYIFIGKIVQKTHVATLSLSFFSLHPLLDHCLNNKHSKLHKKTNESRTVSILPNHEKQSFHHENSTVSISPKETASASTRCFFKEIVLAVVNFIGATMFNQRICHTNYNCKGISSKQNTTKATC